MPCFAVNWPTVSSPLIASSATFALNSAEYLFRLPVIGSVLPSGQTKLNHLSSFRGPPHCDTQRRCMELGFEGHPNYPHCQPMNGDKHANIQYIEFQQLLRALPQLLDDLSP